MAIKEELIMLWLKRNRYYNQLIKCDVSKEVIGPGDFYYQDDVDGVKIKATVYKEMENAKKKAEWDYSKINQAQSEAEYKNLIAEATRQMFASTILDRKVAGKYDPTPESEIIKDLYQAEKDGDMNDY